MKIKQIMTLAVALFVVAPMLTSCKQAVKAATKAAKAAKSSRGQGAVRGGVYMVNKYAREKREEKAREERSRNRYSNSYNYNRY